jgi:tetratricopeptide (TPR) repeat protein
MQATSRRAPSDAPTIEVGSAGASSETADDLRALIDDARKSGDFAAAAAYGERLSGKLELPSKRRVALEGVARDALTAARAALEGALAVGPETPELLARLRDVCEAGEWWRAAVDASTRMVEHATEPRERARLLADAAKLSDEKEGNVERAIELYETAIKNDPEVPGAFAAIESVLVNAGDAPGLAKAYERQLSRLALKKADVSERARLLARLAELQSERLGDLVGAVGTLERVCSLTPDDDAARVRRADLLARLGDTSAAAAELESAVAHAPFEPGLYRRLAQLFTQQSDVERAYAASSVLVALGEADDAERQLYAANAPAAPLTFERKFDVDVWKALEPAGYPALVGELFETLDHAAVRAWVDAANAAGIPASAPEELRIDPKSTTIAAVRSFEWASNILGVEVPALYARADATQVAMATVRAERPAVVFGRSVLTGRSVIELAFLAARHATYLRPGFRLLSFYPTTDELKGLLRAAIAVARVDGPPSSGGPKAQQLEDRLRRNLGDEGAARLRVLLTRINDAGAGANLTDWVIGVELIACRAALIAAGDITVATTLLGVAGGTSAGLSARARMKDLYPFHVSASAAELRKSLGARAAE